MIPMPNCAICNGTGMRVVCVQGQQVVPGWSACSTTYVTCDCCILKPQVCKSQTTRCETCRCGWSVV